MIRPWLRPSIWLTLVCVAGQGVLLAMAKGPAPVWPGVFVLLTLGLAVLVATGRGRTPPPPLDRPLRLLAMMGLALILGLVVWGLVPGGGAQGAAGTDAAAGQERRDEAAVVLADAGSAVDRAHGAAVGERYRDDPWSLVTRLRDHHWERVQTVPQLLPLEVVVWQDGSRRAWSAGAQPLSRPGEAESREVVRSRGAWWLRDVRPRDGWWVETQVRLDPELLGRRWPGLTLTPHSGGTIPAHARALALGAGDGRFTLLVEMSGRGADQRAHGNRSGRWVLLLATWFVVTVMLARLAGGSPGALGGAWLARVVLASADTHQWLAAARPFAGNPAPPDSAASLIDPAYFATPFAGGLFASSADVLFTGLLCGWTVVLVVRRRGGRDFPGASGFWQAPLAGLVTGAALLAARALVSLVAENANARLIGPGIPVDFPSFWFLHLSLVLLGLGPLALATALAGPRSRPATGAAAWRERLLVALTSGGLVAVAGVPWPAVLVGAVGAVVLWTVAPLLIVATMPFRRSIWPMVLVVTAVWTYGVLREVYGAAESAWLENKRGIITAMDEDWNRYLLGDVLEDMRDRDPGSGRGSGLWRDETAWRLWEASALEDLGLPCMVEVVGAEGGSESLHTSGFLGDFQYEVSTRGPWIDVLGEEDAGPEEAVFQTERRVYHGGEEEILAGEISRLDGRGWLRAEIPVRSWRIGTVIERLTGDGPSNATGYRPRAEIDREVMLWRASRGGLEDAGPAGYPGAADGERLASLRRGEMASVVVQVDGRKWRCVWAPLPAAVSRTPGEGFILGLRRSGPGETMLDLSRLLLLHLVLLGIGLGTWQLLRRLVRRSPGRTGPVLWRPGFQERFVGGTFAIGLVLLILLGVAVDGVRQDQILNDARAQARSGLAQAVDQLRSLLVEQGRALAASEYIGELLVGELVGGRPVGPMRLQQAMVFAADGSLLLDETLSDLSDAEAKDLLAAARSAPLVVMREAEAVFVGTVIPIDLGGVLAEAGEDPGLSRRGAGQTGGYFFYRQRLDSGLLGSLADLVRGELTLRLDGVATLASEPGGIFAGGTPLLASPPLMAQVTVHPLGTMVYVDPHRPFAPTGCQPLPVFAREAEGSLVRRALPGVLEADFPDRARLYAQQRRTTGLFLAGLVNLVLLGALLLAVLLSWNIFRPLRLLMSATASLARGDYLAPLPEAGRDEVGQLAGAFAGMRDDLRTAQQSLAARERFLSTVLDRVTVGVAVFDGQGKVVALNPTGRHVLTDFQPELGEEDAASSLLVRFRDLASGRQRHGAELVSPDGTRTLRGALAPMDLPEEPAETMLVFEDVTEYLENQRLALNAELARQVAHEIKNPLTPIQLSAQLLQQAWRDNHPRLESIVEESVARILDQVELLRRIAGEFSLLGRPDDVATEPLDLRHLVENVVGAYAGGGDRAPVMTLDEQALPPVLGHEDSLRKILGNLMQNSLDAATGGTPARVQVDWEFDDEFVTMIWRDGGAGIPAEVAGRLFDPYFSTKSKGTGLGLAICRNLTERMGGRISLANRDDGPGAVARLALRRAGRGKDSV